MLGAMAPSFKNIPNHLPASAGFTTQQMIAYLVFWLIQLPVLFVHPSKLQPFMLVKAIAVPISAFAILGWSVHKANSLGGTGTLLSAPPTVHGKAYAAAFLRSMFVTFIS
jgi:NCS1 family nucleobase:cation symporter-1